MSRGKNSSGTIAKILQDITWDAGLGMKSIFRSLHKQRKPKSKKPPEFVRFVYKGQFYRRPIAPLKSKPPKLLKLPPAGQLIPKPFLTPPNTVAQKAAKAEGSAGSSASSKQQSTWSWKQWWKLNAPLVILNLGSLATLAGFTRTDVIELRSLAITGNASFVMYTLMKGPPIPWNVLFYQFLFASVNAYNIAKIVNERKGVVHLSPHQEEIFNEHFKPYGVTPKQFEKVISNGTVRILKKGDVLSREKDCISSIKLVVRGNTRANVAGRHLTAMGSMRGNRDSMQGGDSGAWIGEMAFLQSLWDKEHQKKGLKSKIGSSTDEGNTIIPKIKYKPSHPSGQEKQCQFKFISTIVAIEEIELIEWSFDDMENVMKTSRELQDSMTRATTASVVGKVVNFMVSRQTSGMPKFSTLMDKWKSSQRQDEVESEEEEEQEVSRSLLNKPS